MDTRLHTLEDYERHCAQLEDQIAALQESLRKVRLRLLTAYGELGADDYVADHYPGSECDGCHRLPCDCDRQYDEWKDRRHDKEYDE